LKSEREVPDQSGVIEQVESTGVDCAGFLFPVTKEAFTTDFTMSRFARRTTEIPGGEVSMRAARVQYLP
jgi:hypothetical protein